MSLPRAKGTERGTVSPGGMCWVCGSSASGSTGSLPSLCLLTEVNVQFHGLVPVNLADKIHELLGGGERRGMT